jgi:hypothetical protein
MDIALMDIAPVADDTPSPDPARMSKHPFLCLWTLRYAVSREIDTGVGMTALQLTRSANASGPLTFRVFQALWIATIVSNVGTWMHDVEAGWLMTSLSPSPLLVALVQTATTLPMFLLALPAGALADWPKS